MTIDDLVQAGQEIISLVDQYHSPPNREMLLDSALYALLYGRFGNVQRQHRVYMYGSTRPQRIDFRYGGTNPVVLEFAVRPPQGGSHLYGRPNASELRKLCRVSKTEARLRALLLVDLYHAPLLKVSLRQSYDAISSGPGNFQRSSVRVVYVHSNEDAAFSFSWRP